jgi:hypothetical protein
MKTVIRLLNKKSNSRNNYIIKSNLSPKNNLNNHQINNKCNQINNKGSMLMIGLIFKMQVLMTFLVYKIKRMLPSNNSKKNKHKTVLQTGIKVFSKQIIIIAIIAIRNKVYNKILRTLILVMNSIITKLNKKNNSNNNHQSNNPIIYGTIFKVRRTSNSKIKNKVTLSRINGQFNLNNNNNKFNKM